MTQWCSDIWLSHVNKYFNYKQTMRNNDTYIGHPLNSSATKQTHSFSKASRFPQRNKITCENFYEIPTTKSQRSTSFGYGEKCLISEKKVVPPPGVYQFQSDFERTSYNNVASIGPGRQKVTFGSFLLQALKRTKHSPSPDRYDPHLPKNSIGGRMGERIKTDPDMKQKKNIPGPGSYHLKSVQIANQGKYALSNFKNATSPRYFGTVSINKNSITTQHYSSEMTNENKTELGKYSNSKFKNIVTRTFGKEQRRGLEDKTKLKFPSFKYRRFSEFGGDF